MKEVHRGNWWSKKYDREWKTIEGWMYRPNYVLMLWPFLEIYISLTFNSQSHWFLFQQTQLTLNLKFSTILTNYLKNTQNQEKSLIFSQSPVTGDSSTVSKDEANQSSLLETRKLPNKKGEGEFQSQSWTTIYDHIAYKGSLEIPVCGR